MVGLLSLYRFHLRRYPPVPGEHRGLRHTGPLRPFPGRPPRLIAARSFAAQSLAVCSIALLFAAASPRSAVAAPPAPAALTPSDSPCLVNFGVTECGPFHLQPAVIVKSALDKPALAARLGRPVQRLATLDGAGIFLLPSEEPAADAQRFARDPAVLYAQPDVTQPPQPHDWLVDAAAARPPEVDPAARPTAAPPGVDRPRIPGTLTELLRTAPANPWPDNRGRGVSIALIDDGFNLECRN